MFRFDPWLRCRNLEWARRPELRPDADDCIMVRVPRGTYRIQGCGAMNRALWQAPLDCSRPSLISAIHQSRNKIAVQALTPTSPIQGSGDDRSGARGAGWRRAVPRRGEMGTPRAVTLIGIGVMLGPASMIVAWACADVAAPPGLAASQCSGTPGMACRRGCRRRGSLRRPPGRPQCRARREQRRTVEL